MLQKCSLTAFSSTVITLLMSMPVLAGTPQCSSPGVHFAEQMADGGSAPPMVVVPAGTFQMGGVDADTLPHRTVGVATPFAVSIYEVSNTEFDHYASATDTRRPDSQNWLRAARPVVDVTWDEASAYTQWLSNMTGATYRLPSEAEWEYIAQASVVGQSIIRQFATCQDCGSPWSDELPAPIGMSLPNSWGIHDLYGNVFEWTADCWHENYTDAPAHSGRWPGGNCMFRMARGGAWSYPAEFADARYRFANWKGKRSYDVGIRLVRELPACSTP